MTREEESEEEMSGEEMSRGKKVGKEMTPNLFIHKIKNKKSRIKR
jgi:hypothetical protein